MITRRAPGITISILLVAMLCLPGCTEEEILTVVENQGDGHTSQIMFVTATLGMAPDIIVTTTADVVDPNDGVVSLREAIIAANNTAGPNVVGFNIPTTDPGFDGVVFTIQPLVYKLPDLNDNGTTIDGATQTDFSGNTNPVGPEIVLDGHFVEDVQITEDGLSIGSSGNHIHSLVIHSFSFDGDGIRMGKPGTGGNRVTGCFIGIDHTGTIAKGNAQCGVDIGNGPENNFIGGSNPGEGNLISGNLGSGVNIYRSDNNMIQGNLIGTDISGTQRVPNSNGVSVSGRNNIVGGTTKNAGNIISGNRFGLSISGSETERNLVQGNFIGTDITGSFSVSNENAGMIIRDDAHDNLVGGIEPGARNIVSGNKAMGLFLGSSHNTILGNYFGVDVSGTSPIPNGGDGFSDGIRIVGSADEIAEDNLIVNNVISANALYGIGIFSSGHNIIKGNLIGLDKNGMPMGNAGTGIHIQRGPDPINAVGNVIGGPAERDRNEIAGNLSGIQLSEAVGTIVEGNSIHDNIVRGIIVLTPGIRNMITANAIYANGDLGIDLAEDGITNNDPGDTDTGPNNLQNYPVLTFALATPGRLVVKGTLDTPNPETATIELFANPVPDPGGDPSGHGEGMVFLGSKRPNPGGEFTVTLPAVTPGTLISATATDASGNTSEFSENIEATAPGE